MNDKDIKELYQLAQIHANDIDKLKLIRDYALSFVPSDDEETSVKEKTLKLVKSKL